ncbi:MAG: hypothetical protein JKY54_12685, partial [Flavobacteriales bacterium]|nr:hypothetical protein [Flavobacteriales bacterium]
MEEIDSGFANSTPDDNQEFVKFKSVQDEYQANDYVNLLEEQGISVKLTNNISSLDQSFSGHTLNDTYFISILRGDFEKANHIIQGEADRIIDELDDD